MLDAAVLVMLDVERTSGTDGDVGTGSRGIEVEVDGEFREYCTGEVERAGTGGANELSYSSGGGPVYDFLRLVTMNVPVPVAISLSLPLPFDLCLIGVIDIGAEMDVGKGGRSGAAQSEDRRPALVVLTLDSVPMECPSAVAAF